MPLRKLKEYLDARGVSYETITHMPAFTAHEVAAAANVPARQVAKTVMIKVDGRMAMAVLPASYKIDFDLLKTTTGTSDIELATEDEFKVLFPECAVGAMPPFGNLYGMDVYVAEKLTEDDWIVFCAGSHTECLKMSYEDYEDLVQPIIIRLALT